LTLTQVDTETTVPHTLVSKCIIQIQCNYNVAVNQYIGEQTPHGNSIIRIFRTTKPSVIQDLKTCRDVGKAHTIYKEIVWENKDRHDAVSKPRQCHVKRVHTVLRLFLVK